jgi:hypothetical protein
VFQSKIAAMAPDHHTMTKNKTVTVEVLTYALNNERSGTIGPCQAMDQSDDLPWSPLSLVKMRVALGMRVGTYKIYHVLVVTRGGQRIPTLSWLTTCQG